MVRQKHTCTHIKFYPCSDRLFSVSADEINKCTPFMIRVVTEKTGVI